MRPRRAVNDLRQLSRLVARHALGGLTHPVGSGLQVVLKLRYVEAVDRVHPLQEESRCIVYVAGLLECRIDIVRVSDIPSYLRQRLRQRLNRLQQRLPPEIGESLVPVGRVGCSQQQVSLRAVAVPKIVDSVFIWTELFYPPLLGETPCNRSYIDASPVLPQEFLGGLGDADVLEEGCQLFLRKRGVGEVGDVRPPVVVRAIVCHALAASGSESRGWAIPAPSVRPSTLPSAASPPVIVAPVDPSPSARRYVAAADPARRRRRSSRLA